MRFDEYLEEHGVAVSPVDRFAGLVVRVGVPRGWEPFDSAVGARVWVCRTDPRIDVFGANAVLTMHRVEAPLDAGEVFAMLSEQQSQSVPGCRELQREFAPAADSLGFRGLLALEIASELGRIDSVSRSRIIAAAEGTLIAQLTVTALQDSPVEQTPIRLSVHKGAPVVGPNCDSHNHSGPLSTSRGNR